MESKSRAKTVDFLLILLIVLPLLCVMALKVLTAPAAPLSDGVQISGAQIYVTVPLPVQELPITEAQVNSWAVMLSILGLCLYLTHGIKVIPDSKRQLAAEWIVDTVNKLVRNNMGEKFMSFAPFVAGIMALSALSSLSSLLGLFAPTSDVNIILGWAILVFISSSRAACGRTSRAFSARSRCLRRSTSSAKSPRPFPCPSVITATS